MLQLVVCTARCAALSILQDTSTETQPHETQNRRRSCVASGSWLFAEWVNLPRHSLVCAYNQDLEAPILCSLYQFAHKPFQRAASSQVKTCMSYLSWQYFCKQAASLHAAVPNTCATCCAQAGWTCKTAVSSPAKSWLQDCVYASVGELVRTICKLPGRTSITASCLQICQFKPVRWQNQSPKRWGCVALFLEKLPCLGVRRHHNEAGSEGWVWVMLEQSGKVGNGGACLRIHPLCLFAASSRNASWNWFWTDPDNGKLAKGT